MPYYFYEEFVSVKTRGMTLEQTKKSIDGINEDFEKVHGKQNIDYRFAKFKEPISDEYKWKKND